MFDPDSALITDLYQLTMLHCYHDQGMEGTAVFELYVRRLPPERGFLTAAGLDTALGFLENFQFKPHELDGLAGLGLFDRGFLDYLGRLRFTGDVDAVPEGTVVFPHEPILRVTAPLPQAQIVESRLINLLHYQTLIASKAARCVLAAPGKTLVDFGLRRAHGAEAALMAARASYLAGFDATATVLAGLRYDIPVVGTMAHSLVLAHDREELAFEHFAHAQPDNVVLLIDTYDTEAAARKLAPVAARLAEQGIKIKGVRLDSGDLAAHAFNVRRILDDSGLHGVTIFASGDLDEYRLEALYQSGAPIDGYGIGTQLDISADAPSLDCVYKLQEYAGKPRRKRSAGKATWPGRKQIYRQSADGVLTGDCLGLIDHPHPGEPLLQPAMRGGKRVAVAESLPAIRRRSAYQLKRLPPALRANRTEPPYPVEIAPELQRMAAELDNAAN